MAWREVDLQGAKGISRVCGVYEITDMGRIPGGKFKVKVLECSRDFMAVPNVCSRAPDGTPDWMVGLGASEEEALQAAIVYTMGQLSKQESWRDEQLEWADPRDF